MDQGILDRLMEMAESEAAAENSMNTESAVATSLAYTSEKQ